VTTDGGTIVVEDSLGASGTAIVEWPLTGGRYKLALQYGTGAAFDFRSVLTRSAGRTFVPGEHVHLDDLWQFRIVSDLLIEQRGPWELQALALYQELENGASSNSRFTGYRLVHDRCAASAGSSRWRPKPAGTTPSRATCQAGRCSSSPWPRRSRPR
jgi:hypothetical protein